MDGQGEMAGAGFFERGYEATTVGNDHGLMAACDQMVRLHHDDAFHAASVQFGEDLEHFHARQHGFSGLRLRAERGA